jgi:hypothetical protein
MAVPFYSEFSVSFCFGTEKIDLDIVLLGNLN